jgi:hypothetical protein
MKVRTFINETGACGLWGFTLQFILFSYKYNFLTVYYANENIK